MNSGTGPDRDPVNPASPASRPGRRAVIGALSGVALAAAGAACGSAEPPARRVRPEAGRTDAASSWP
ncbi:hypothetical protein [Streptomyces alfalfae]